jgi:hypothetical protein
MELRGINPTGDLRQLGWRHITEALTDPFQLGFEPSEGFDHLGVSLVGAANDHIVSTGFDPSRIAPPIEPKADDGGA